MSELIDLEQYDDLEIVSQTSQTQSRRTSKRDIPYDELDANIVSLVRALNRYPAVITI
jgi:hypothetical protein